MLARAWKCHSLLLETSCVWTIKCKVNLTFLQDPVWSLMKDVAPNAKMMLKSFIDTR